MTAASVQMRSINFVKVKLAVMRSFGVLQYRVLLCNVTSRCERQVPGFQLHGDGKKGCIQRSSAGTQTVTQGTSHNAEVPWCNFQNTKLEYERSRSCLVSPDTRLLTCAFCDVFLACQLILLWGSPAASFSLVQAWFFQKLFIALNSSLTL